MKDVNNLALARKQNSAEQRKNFGRRRGQWLDQVFDDPRMTGAPACVMYAVSRHVDPSLTCNPGDFTLAKKAHVTERTVRSSISLAVERGHIEVEPAAGHRTRVIKLVQTGKDFPSETGKDFPSEGVQTGSQTGSQTGNGFRGSLVESTGSAPNYHNSHNSQERRLVPAAPGTGSGYREESVIQRSEIGVAAGHNSDSRIGGGPTDAITRTESPATPSGSKTEIKKSSDSPLPRAGAASPPNKLVELKAELSALNVIAFDDQEAGREISCLGDLRRVRAEINKLEDDMRWRQAKKSSAPAPAPVVAQTPKAKLADLKARLYKVENSVGLGQTISSARRKNAALIMQLRLAIAETEHAIDPNKPESIVFEGKVIRLTRSQYLKWQQAFPLLKLYEVLPELDEWASGKGMGKFGNRWFRAVEGLLRNRNEEVRQNPAKAQPVKRWVVL